MMKNQEDWEDFRQFVLESQLNGRRTNRKYYLIDYLRNHLGDRRNNKRETNDLRIRLHLARTFNDMCKDNDPRGLELIYAEFEEFIALFKNDDRIILLLRYFWGFSLNEIGMLYNLTDGCISKKVKNLKEIVKYLYEEEKYDNIFLEYFYLTKNKIIKK